VAGEVMFPGTWGTLMVTWTQPARKITVMRIAIADNSVIFIGIAVFLFQVYFTIGMYLSGEYTETLKRTALIIFQSVFYYE
jgi:hypothetical protein